MRGVAAMLVREATLSGRISDPARRLAVLEVDEATLPLILRESPPGAVVFTNLFRDQLDRYGEVDTVARGWERALASLDAAAPPAIVLNADDPAVAHLGKSYRGPVVYYGVEDPTAGGESVEHASDFRICLECGAALEYAIAYYGHLGRWRCPACGNARPAPAAVATRVARDGNGTTIDVELAASSLRVVLPLTGLYNAYNALAAIAAAAALGLPHDAVVRALASFDAAFGRQERFRIDGRDVRVLLGKNPTGLNQVLRDIAATPGERRLLFFLNDGIADGRDVSWIWDADYELARDGASWAMAAGTRADDLALRLTYAGFDDVRAERDVRIAVRDAIARTPAGGTLTVVPTYTAMLEVRELLARLAGAGRYWEDGA
jgi:UDP-N-acetylmuramyl tripeptide synthase